MGIRDGYAIPRPLHPPAFQNPRMREMLMSPVPIEQQRPQMRPPNVPQMPPRPVKTSAVPPGAMPQAPLPQPGPIPAMGFKLPPVPGAAASAQPGGRVPFGQRLKNFVGSDAALAMAAGILGPVGPGGMTSGEAIGQGLAAALQARQPKSSDIAAFEYAKKDGFTGSFTDFLRTEASSNQKFGLTPTYAVGENGEILIGQAYSGGGYKYYDEAGNPYKGRATPVSPEELARMKSRGAAVGGAEGDALASYKSMKSKLPGLEGVVNDLERLADTATYTFAGLARDEIMRQTGQEPTQGAIDRATYIAMVDNQILPLLRDTFGAQFTVQEGESLRATLGDPNKSPAEKKQVLKAFIAQKRRDVEALAREAGLKPDTAKSISEMSNEELQAIIDGP